MKMHICIIGVWVAFAGTIQVAAQQKLDTYFDHLLANKKMMGSVSISFNDSIIYNKSIGFSNADTKKENKQDTKFRIGSLTKTYTAVLVLQAVENQRLRLDDKLSSFYPEIDNAEKITIEQLLKHRSGIFNFTEITGESLWELQPHTEDEFINYFVSEKSNFEPGSDFEYSNTNYALLGFILQKIYSKPFSEILEENICHLLHLENTYFSAETNETKNEALSYNIQDKYLQNAKVHFSNHPASGGMVSTAVEVNKFLSALFGGKLITAESLEMMLPVNKGEYGMGIEKLPFNNPEGYAHGGRIENYFSEYWYFPKEKLGIVTLSNAVNIELGNIQMALLQYAYGNHPALPDFNQVNGLSEKEFKQISGTYCKKGETGTITISSDGENMVFQKSTTGQMYVPFEYKGNNVFEYEDIKLYFSPSRKEVRLEQGDIVEKYIQMPGE